MIRILVLLMLLLPSISEAQIHDVITYFNAGYDKDQFVLSWKITSAKDASKFLIQKRKSSSADFKVVCEIPFSNFRTRTDSLQEYSYVCTDKPDENGVYYYSLTLIDKSSSAIGSPQILKIGITEVPEFILKQNSPNPFNPSTSVPYVVLAPTNIRISVYTLTGKLIDVLVDSYHTPGNYSVTFNASKYSEISSGIYFYKLESEYSTDIRKMIFAK